MLLASAGGSLAQSQNDFYYSWLEASAEAESYPRHFRLGVLAGLNLKADFRMSGTFAISGSQPGQPVAGIDHFYDDGYVRVDQTGNAGGYTSYWGYNNAAQASDGSLLFHSATSFTANGAASESGDMQPGLDLAYGGHLYRFGKAWVGWEMGFGWLAIDIEDRNTLAINANRTVHSFTTGGIVLPGAPYNGGSSGVGPVISDGPTELLGGDTINGTLGGARTLDVSLYSLRFGPTLHWELPWRLALQVSGGAAVGFISGELKFNETLQFTDGSSTVNRGSFSDDKFVYGGYVGATLMYHAVKNGDFYIGVQYMPLGSATFSGGGALGGFEHVRRCLYLRGHQLAVLNFWQISGDQKICHENAPTARTARAAADLCREFFNAERAKFFAKTAEKLGSALRCVSPWRPLCLLGLTED